MESPVAEKENISTTGQQNNHNQVIDDLQNQISSLEIRLKQALKQKRELEQQLADVEREKDILRDGTVIKRLTEQLRELERENQRLRLEPQTAANSVEPDDFASRDSVRSASASAEALRQVADRTLNKLKVGKQSAAGKAIEAFIKELKQ